MAVKRIVHVGSHRYRYSFANLLQPFRRARHNKPVT
jgi:hypothetical protein